MTRVAVVAVHGVADQKPTESARAIADLLCADSSKYSAFTEVPLRIARKRMEPGHPANADDGIEYMHAQLQHYPQADEDAGNVYETVRLEGTRKSDGADVHVHEVYWADLSRAGETWYRLLAEFYQLILHLPSLGRNGLRYTKNDSLLWRATYEVQRFTVWMLTVPAVLLNVVLLSIGVITLAAEVPLAYRELTATCLGAGMLTGAVVALLRALKLRKTLWMTWPLIVAASLAIAVLIVAFRNSTEVLAVEATLIAGGLSFFVAVKYSVLKPTAKRFGAISVLAMVGTAIYHIVGKVIDEATAYAAAVATAQLLYPFLVAAWLFVFAGAVVAAGCGVAAALMTPKGKRSAAWRTTWTARFSLGLPASLFTIFTLSIWYWVVRAIEWRSADPQAAGVVRNMFFDSARGFEIFVIATGIFVVAALFAALPSIALEIKPARTATDDESASLGKWLSRGIIVVAVAAEIFTLALAMMLLITKWEAYNPLSEAAVGMMLAGSAFVIASLLVGKRFITTFRAVVDVLLDVDNYLRESPADATPRARIAERFVSLLRHLSANYDRIVIVAHSQGTVISADVLRYLRAVPDPAITKPIRLYTMGSPLRQLYEAAFPYLYAWLGGDTHTPQVDVWANVYRSGDYVGRGLWADETTYARIWIRAVPAEVERPRAEFCIGAGAHTHYWNRHAKDVGVYLDRLIE